MNHSTGQASTDLEQAEQEAWFAQVLDVLRGAGPEARAFVDYIDQEGVTLGFSPQRHSSASWFDWRRLRRGIFLRPAYARRDPHDPDLAVMIAHEALHLRQGVLEALSVRGELEAWQSEYALACRLSASRAVSAKAALTELDPNSRDDLKRARALMGQIGGPAYRIGWLPLEPLPAEMRHWIRRLLGLSHKEDDR